MLAALAVSVLVDDDASTALIVSSILSERLLAAAVSEAVAVVSDSEVESLADDREELALLSVTQKQTYILLSISLYTYPRATLPAG